MPVAFDSSVAKKGTAAGTGSLSANHVVNTLVDDLVAVVGVLWLGSVDASSGTVGVTFNGVSMSPGTVIRWNSNKCALYPFTLVNPASGSVAVSVSSMASTGSLALVSATYSGVATIGSVTTASTGASASNSVTVTSVAAAHRVVTIHGAGAASSSSDSFTYNQTRRAGSNIAGSGAVLLGDAPGTTSVTGTATQVSTANWGAIGINLTPSVVLLDASLEVALSMSGGAAIYRVEEPSPRRTWVIA